MHLQFERGFPWYGESGKISYNCDPHPISEYFYSYDSEFSACIYLVINAYVAKGETAEIEMLLESSHTELVGSNLNKTYPSLREYYAITQSLLDYCKNPTGSFEQAITTIEDYRNQARKCYHDLDYDLDIVT